ncbi:carbohydrate kinase [Streptococcus sp. E17BB]|uniref:carbohydrate kinase n=1 Tax=Streptococcus sp. E17BB TaxID=3278714 RepID=UPI00359E5AB6
MLTTNEQRILALLEQDPFLSQQEIADHLGLNRSTVAGLISNLMAKKYLLGRAYVLNHATEVICIGGMNMDRKYVLGDNWQPKTSNPVMASMSVGGVARNIAENLGRLGQAVSLLSVAGRDHDYDWIRTQTESYVNLQQVTQIEGQTTSSYTAILDSQGDMQLGLADMAICDQMTPDWLYRHRSWLAQARLLVVDLNLPLETVTATIELAKQQEQELVVIPVSSPKMTHLPQDLTGVTWLVVNQDESEAYFGCQVASEEDVTALAEKWLSRGLEHVLMTRGSQASYYANQSGERQYIQPPRVEKVVDVTGAGDSFSAGLIHGLLEGKSAIEAIAYGLTNAYHTIQTDATVRVDLSAQLLEQNYQQLKEKGEI